MDNKNLKYWLKIAFNKGNSQTNRALFVLRVNLLSYHNSSISIVRNTLTLNSYPNIRTL